MDIALFKIIITFLIILYIFMLLLNIIDEYIKIKQKKVTKK